MEAGKLPDEATQNIFFLKVAQYEGSASQLQAFGEKSVRQDREGAKTQTRWWKEPDKAENCFNFLSVPSLGDDMRVGRYNCIFQIYF